jgi:hypothetical protein
MTRMAIAASFLLCGAGLAHAQSVPAGFPLDREYRGISISGFDVQRSGLTLTVRRDPKSKQAAGAGSTGCNQWTAAFVFRDCDALDVIDIVTTRKACAKARMTTEQAFITTLRSTQRWRVDGNRLILEGEAGRLLMSASAGKPTKS